MKSINDTFELNNGVKMPCYGVGTYGLKIEDECKQAVRWSLELGVRSIDCASAYKNEHWVAEVIEDLGIKREDLFLTSKVWNIDQGYCETKKAFEKSLERLKTDYLDLYLIHWPCPKAGKYVDSWKAMIDLYKEGRIRAIGVSNFYEEHIQKLINETGFTPALDQLEYHPWLQEKKLHKFLKNNRIQLESWSPLVRGKIFEDITLKEIAKKHKKTVSQIVLRWNIQNNVIIIPRSKNVEHIKENMDIFDFELDDKDMDRISNIDINYRNGFDSNEYHQDAVK